MARKPPKKAKRQKPPSVNQRHRARANQAGAPQRNGTADVPAPRHKPDVRINKAQRLWAEHRYEEATWFYERALARDPHNAVLLVDVARAYALRYRYTDAQKLIQLAETLYPDDPQLQKMLGESYLMIQQFDRAIACFRRYLELAPSARDRPPILLELARMHERLHDLDAARQCAEEALALNPGYELARYTLATIERRSGDVAGAESRWRELIDAKRAAPGVIADSWYQLAAIHDKSGRYDEAFDSLTNAKKIVDHAAAPYQHDATMIARIAGKSFSKITAENCERWHAAGPELAPLGGGLALLCSHPRSGTTLLEQVLDSHPTVISADEIQVMADLVYMGLGRKAQPNESVPETLDRLPVEDIAAARQAYWAGMEGALRQPIGQRLLLDKNPELTMLLPLVARVFPEMRILFAVRDPRDVVISCFVQQLPLNPVSVHYLTLESTARKYTRSMAAWFKIRAMLRNPWIEIRYEDMVADLESQARKALDFLGLPWDEVVLGYHRRAQQKHVHSPTYEAVTKPVYTSSIGRWRNYAPQLEPCLPTLEPYIEAFGYGGS
jgi:tetratricopeptide (TPR) repeat protein